MLSPSYSSSSSSKRRAAAKRLPIFSGVPAPTRLQVTAISTQTKTLLDTLKGYTPYYTKYDIQAFHNRGIKGNNVSIVIIDCGLLSAKSNLLSNVNFVSLRKSSYTGSAHGIAVASLVASQTRDGMSGIAPEATVTLIDVDDENGDIKLSSVLQAVNHSLTLEPDIVNISLGTNVSDDTLYQAIKRLTDSGTLVFAAAGNAGSRVYEFPAAYPGVICVGSIGSNGDLSSFNSRNDTVSVFAPGERMTQGRIKDSFEVSSLDGTSFSSPFAAALIALRLSELRSTNPNATIQRNEAIQFLRETLENNCSTHMYVQENFSTFGCTNLNFSGRSELINAPNCYPYIRTNVFLVGLSSCLALALILALATHTDTCQKMCKVVFKK